MIHKENKQYDQCDLYNIGQLLLKLSNDVEENPGPAINHIVDWSYTIHASFNQGNNLFRWKTMCGNVIKCNCVQRNQISEYLEPNNSKHNHGMWG